MEMKNDGINARGVRVSRDDIRKDVREILEHLVAHFGQTIHIEVILNSFSKDSTGVILLSSTIDGSRRDQLEHQERETPPIVQLWLDRLLSLGLGSEDEGGFVESTCRTNRKILITILCEWISGYEEIVRPRIFQAEGISGPIPAFDERCIPVLKNYELVLSTLLLKSMHMEENQTSISALVSGSEKPFGCSKSLLRVVNLLCTDVTLLTVTTSSSEKEAKTDEKNHFRRNEAIPALLQSMGNAIETLRQMISNKDQSADGFEELLSQCYGSLRLCAVTILAFDVFNSKDDDSYSTNSRTLLPHILSPSLSTCVTSRNTDLTLLQRILEHTEIETRDGAQESSIAARKHLEKVLAADSQLYDDIGDDYWNSLLSSSGSVCIAGWIDSNPMNARGTLRIVRSIWRSMAAFLPILSKGMYNQSHGVEADVSDSNTLQELYNFVLKGLGGPDPVLREARAHFFGRNSHGMDDLAKWKRKSNPSNEVDNMELSSVVIKMGRRVTKTKTNTDEDGSPTGTPINERVPVRTAGAVNALRFLLAPKLIDPSNACKENMLESIFPICAALLDSNNTGFAALGAAGFLRTFDALVPQEMHPTSKDSVPEECPLYKVDSIVSTVTWMNFAENTLAVLERSLQSNPDHGHLIVAIGLTQSRLFEIVLSAERQINVEEKQQRANKRGHDFRRRRRIATEQWLWKLERSLYHPATERQHLEILLGGVIPLLSQHALDEMGGADGMELGRLGLAALLPITVNVTAKDDMTQQSGNEQIGRKTQMACLVALVNLIFAAYPIMRKHGGKLMSHLLTAAASTTPSIRNDGDSVMEGELIENDPKIHSIRNMAVLAAAIVIVACQSKCAAELLESIENNCGQYEQNLLNIVSEVRQLAAGLEQYCKS